jgi:hypothetical protein
MESKTWSPEPMNPDVVTVVQHLSRYLITHPDACDTSEGIARWWISEDGPVPVAVVEAALDWMAARGVVKSTQAADGRVRYHRAKGEEPDTRIAAMAADPQAVMAPLSPRKPPRGVH